MDAIGGITMKILSIQKVSKKYFIVEYKHLKQYNRAMHTNLESIERFLNKNKIYNKQKAFCMLDNLKEKIKNLHNSAELTEEEKQQSFLLIRKQLRNAKSYKDSPALCYLFDCRNFLRKSLKED